jgi:two-component system, OmpR family, alkaline phosphatase synthesis response regulator PhoP
MTASVLIVEDERHLAEGLAFNLEAEGYSADVVGDGVAALARLLAPDCPYDAVVLDVMLPGLNGFEVVARLRQAEQFVPVLMLTARGRPEDVLKGFEAGADDYLPKPFELAILLARLGGLLRRRDWGRTRLPAVAPSAKPRDAFAFAGKTIDFGELELRAADRVVRLTVMEAKLLNYLVRHAGTTVTRKALLEDVWGLHEDTDTRAIDNFITRLRRYVEDEPTKPRHLVTVRGLGYRFMPEPE